MLHADSNTFPIQECRPFAEAAHIRLAKEERTKLVIHLSRRPHPDRSQAVIRTLRDRQYNKLKHLR